MISDSGLLFWATLYVTIDALAIFKSGDAT